MEAVVERGVLGVVQVVTPRFAISQISLMVWFGSIARVITSKNI
jgi:hypothetical protein